MEKNLIIWEEMLKNRKTFSVPITKVRRTGTNGKEITKIISYKLEFIDSTRFMQAHYIDDNLAEGIHKKMRKRTK